MKKTTTGVMSELCHCYYTAVLDGLVITDYFNSSLPLLLRLIPTFIAEPEELVYADVSILKRKKKRSELKETGEEKVEYGEVNLQKCPTPEEVHLGGVFSLIVYAEIQSGNQRGQSVIHSM